MPIPQCLCICINTTDRIIIPLKLHRRGDLPGAKTQTLLAQPQQQWNIMCMCTYTFTLDDRGDRPESLLYS